MARDGSDGSRNDDTGDWTKWSPYGEHRPAPSPRPAPPASSWETPPAEAARPAPVPPAGPSVRSSEPLPEHLSPYRAAGSGNPRRPAASPERPSPPPYAPPPSASQPKSRRPRWGRRIGIVLLVLVLLLVGFVAYLDFSLKRIDALPDYDGRPADSPGTTWLLVGSDSREGLTEEQQNDLATGNAAGKRTDTIILVHVPSADVPPTLVSLPRDTLVTLPGHGQQKLNAAYAFGGAALLTRTVEGLTNLRIDRYAEIGLSGFAGMVDAIGGVNICLEQPIDDPKAGINLPAGCQDLDGAKALGYVRTRATARADLDRVVRQRQMLSIILGKAKSFGTIVNPFRSVPLALAVTGSLTVDDGTHIWNLAGLGLAMGDATLVTTTTPIASTPTISGVGSVVKIDAAKAEQLFGALRADQAVPAALVSK